MAATIASASAPGTNSRRPPPHAPLDRPGRSHGTASCRSGHHWTMPASGRSFPARRSSASAATRFVRNVLIAIGNSGDAGTLAGRCRGLLARSLARRPGGGGLGAVAAAARNAGMNWARQMVASRRDRCIDVRDEWSVRGHVPEHSRSYKPSNIRGDALVAAQAFDISLAQKAGLNALPYN